MREFMKRLSLLLVCFVTISLIFSVVPAEAAVKWKFSTSDGKKKADVNSTITVKKQDKYDMNLYRNGKQIKENDATYKVSWYSSDKNVVYIDKQSGVLRADKYKQMPKDTATAKITAVIKNKKTGGTTKQSFKIKVVSNSVAKPTATPVPVAHTIYEGTTVELSKAKVGDVVLFGSYEQDNVASNGAEAIPWYVLDKDGDKLMLMSVYLLDCVKYHEEWESITWEDCTLRQWMNDDFYNSAFTKSEKKHILTSYLKNEDNPYYGTEGGNDTEDKVFALSLEEAKPYFGIAEEWGYYHVSALPELSAAKVTAYAEAQGVMVSSFETTAGNGWWWLRSPGRDNSSAADVSNGGDVIVIGADVDLDSDAARPALWLNLNPTATPTPIPIKDETPASVFTYRISDNSVIITGLKDKTLTDITIPRMIDGYPVTSIGSSAFSYCRSLSSITVTKGSYAEQWAKDNGYADILAIK